MKQSPLRVGPGIGRGKLQSGCAEDTDILKI